MWVLPMRTRTRKGMVMRYSKAATTVVLRRAFGGAMIVVDMNSAQRPIVEASSGKVSFAAQRRCISVAALPLRVLLDRVLAPIAKPASQQRRQKKASVDDGMAWERERKRKSGCAVITSESEAEAELVRREASGRFQWGKVETA